MTSIAGSTMADEGDHLSQINAISSDPPPQSRSARFAALATSHKPGSPVHNGIVLLDSGNSIIQGSCISLDFFHRLGLTHEDRHPDSSHPTPIGVENDPVTTLGRVNPNTLFVALVHKSEMKWICIEPVIMPKMGDDLNVGCADLVQNGITIGTPDNATVCAKQDNGEWIYPVPQKFNAGRECTLSELTIPPPTSAQHVLYF